MNSGYYGLLGGPYGPGLLGNTPSWNRDWQNQPTMPFPSPLFQQQPGMYGEDTTNQMGGGAGYDQLQQPQGLPRIPFKDNPAVTAVGAGLLNYGLTGRSDFSGVPAGIAAKSAMQERAATRQDAEERRKAMGEVIKNYKGLTPDQRAYYMANPGAFDPAALGGGVKPTDDMREYDFAVGQGYQGSFTDYMTDMRKAGANNITVGGGKFGTIPSGYELVETPDGVRMQPIPGSPADAEQKAAEEQAALGRETRETSANVVVDDIDRSLAQIEKSPTWTTGIIGDATKSIPGMPAHDVSKLLDTVKANAGFDRLQQMRDSSPTGGALGQVSERENALLQAAIGNLEQSQGKEQLIYNLKRVKNIYLDIIHGEGKGPPRESLDAEQGTVPEVATPTDDGWTDLGDGVRIRPVQ